MTVGLPIDGSDDKDGEQQQQQQQQQVEEDSLAAKKTAEIELQRRIANLREELQSATSALERLQRGGPRTPSARETLEAAAFVSGGTVASPTSPRSTSSTVVTELTKKGYLFKWMDRSIGWSGTKWALRFVELNGGRISYYGSHTDSQPRYVLNLKGCAVREDGWKRNRRHHGARKGGEDPPLDEPGAYFFIFSIYQRKPTQQQFQNESFDMDDSNTDDTIVPLLRFSTPSLAEKTQWVQLISEACAYCETEEYASDEAMRINELLVQQQQQAKMASAMPEAKEGTLPPLYFAPAIRAPAKRPSFNRRQRKPDSKMFRSRSRNFGDADKVDARSTKGYPPSKPMHRAAAPSLLSMEAPAQNYRGLFNLGIIILVVSNFRLMLGTVRRHGFVLTRLWHHLGSSMVHVAPDFRRRDSWEEFPFVTGFALQLVFITIGFFIEWLLSKKRIGSRLGMVLHHINAHSALFLPMAIVWHWISNPAIGAVLLLHATITWMKLISYMHANEDYRLSCQSKEGLEVCKATMALVENLDAGDAKIVYPENVTLGNMVYFWFAPTLTYQIAFPKYPRVRFWKVAGILLRMIVAVTIFTFLAAQVVSPALESLVGDLEATNGTFTASILAEYWLRLSIANTYLWLLMFYVYFHLYLNLFAELLRFGDRVFYRDWWNSSEVSAYWRLWNTPVHYWLIRHVYFPCLRKKMSRIGATFVVFLLSAIMHEVLVSVPFHMIRPWSFIGMMMQIPLVATTKFLNRKFPGSSIGNMIFWMSFCVVGQPMAILLYTVDYQYGKHRAMHEAASDLMMMEQDACRIRWHGKCLIR